MKSLVEISRFISLVLRHKPEALDITLDEHGWADVETLVAKLNQRQPFTMEMLEKIVREDNKQRYSFNEDKTLIRANQGHSIPVDVELEQKEPPEYLWHGTGERFRAPILAEGLTPQSRLYVHLSRDTQTAVTVGKRHGKPLLFRVHAGRMAKDGYAFYLSVNGVWLTKAVPPQYLEVWLPGEGEHC